MKRAGLLSLLTLFCLATQLFGVDATGHWRLLRHTNDGNTLETFLDLKQEGSKLTGTLMVDWCDLPISGGQLESNKISFNVEIDPTYAFRFTGEINDNQMRLTQ